MYWVLEILRCFYWFYTKKHKFSLEKVIHIYHSIITVYRICAFSRTYVPAFLFALSSTSFYKVTYTLYLYKIYKNLFNFYMQLSKYFYRFHYTIFLIIHNSFFSALLTNLFLLVNCLLLKTQTLFYTSFFNFNFFLLYYTFTIFLLSILYFFLLWNFNKFLFLDFLLVTFRFSFIYTYTY